MKINRSVLIVCCLSLMQFQCKKYPEDSFLSLKKPIGRLDGTWIIKSYKIDGKESIEDVQSFFGNCWGVFQFLEGDYYDNFRIHGDDCSLHGKFIFKGKKMIMLNTANFNYYNRSEKIPIPDMNFPYAIADIIYWDILELYKGKLVFSCVYQKKEQRIEATKR